VNAFRLVLSDDHVSDRGTRQQVEYGVGIGTLSLLVAAALNTLVALHLTVEDLTGLDVHGLIEDNSLLGYGEL